MARSSRIRVVNDDVGHRLAGLPGNPPSSTASAVGPTVLVPDEDQRWSFEFKDWSEDHVEQELATLQEAVECAYLAPAVVNEESVLLSPPSGKFGIRPSQYGMFTIPERILPDRVRQVITPEMYLVRYVHDTRTDSSRQSTASHYARNVPSTACVRCPNGLFPTKVRQVPEIERILLCLATRRCCLATRHCSRRCAELSLAAVLLSGGATDGSKRS